MGTRVVFEFDSWGLLLGQWSLLWEHWLVGPWRFEWNFREMIFKLILQIDSWGIYCEITLRRMSLDLTDDKSTLVQVMTWCHQATSHYLSQCWPRSLLPYDGSRPQDLPKMEKGCFLSIMMTKKKPQYFSISNNFFPISYHRHPVFEIAYCMQQRVIFDNFIMRSDCISFYATNSNPRHSIQTNRSIGCILND